MRDGYRRRALPRPATPHQMDVLAAYVAGGTVSDAAALMGIQPSTAKRHLADLRAKSGLSTEQLVYSTGSRRSLDGSFCVEPLVAYP